MDAQFKKGVLEMCLITSVEKEEQYGYDIIKKLHGYFPEMNESSFYAILRRLNREGILEQFPGRESGGPPRKYYRVTPKGKERLSQQISDWRGLVSIVEKLGVK